MLTKDLVKRILEYPDDRHWEVQGFGMLRTYLGEKEEDADRLQIWDPRLQVWGNNAIHDHPWDFTSTIIAGTLYNERFITMHRGVDAAIYAHLPMARYRMVEIKPGIGGGVMGEEQEAILGRFPVEVYQCGDQYSQKGAEFHVTRYEPSTITLLVRQNRTNDIAHSLWRGDVEWCFYEPRPATHKERDAVIGRALDRWWL